MSKIAATNNCGVYKSTTHAASKQGVTETARDERSARSASSFSAFSLVDSPLRGGVAGPTPKHDRMDRTTKAEVLLRELGGRARLVVYVASAPGAGKTRRLLEDARRMHDAGKRVAIGWIETKGRPDLERVASGLPRIPPRQVKIGERMYEDFDFDGALRNKPDIILLDELAHENLGTAAHAKRWQDALALREAGIGVIGAFNIQHLETVAPIAEGLIGYPVREIIPLSFLQAADEVIALDVSPRLLQNRVRAGKIVNEQDIERALAGVFKEQTLYMLRELLLRTVDSLTLPVVKAGRTSVAAAFVEPDSDPVAVLEANGGDRARARPRTRGRTGGVRRPARAGTSRARGRRRDSARCLRPRDRHRRRRLARFTGRASVR